MTTLSLMLYLASVLSNLQGVLVAIAICSGLFAVVSVVAIGIYNDSAYNEISVFKYIKILWVTVVCAFIAALIPSERTMYLIVASEIIQTAVLSTDGQEIMNNVKNKINSMLKEEEKK